MLNVWHQDSSFSQGRFFPLSCSWHLDFATRQDEQVFFQPAQAFHTHHTHKILAFFTDFLLKRSVSLIPPCFNLFICVPLPVFFVKKESTVHEQQKCLVKYNLCPLLGTTRARNHKKAWQNRACSLAESEGTEAPLTFILSPFFCRVSVLGIKITSHPWQVWLMGCHGGQLGTGSKWQNKIPHRF